MALRLISTWMTNRPDTSVRSVARQVVSEKSRLSYLEHGLVSMWLTIELSYRHLDHDARKAFRFLPAVPGSAATADDLGRGLELTPDVTEPVLYRLVDAASPAARTSTTSTCRCSGCSSSSASRRWNSSRRRSPPTW
jgi:hypothetical protein